MTENSADRTSTRSRRQFLQASGALLAASAFGAAAPRVHAAEANTINIALIGCGGRGAGAAANALNTKSQGPVKLVAMADVFENRLQGSLKALTNQCPGQVDVPAERQFLGFDGYRKAIDALGPSDLVLLCTPPAFRPIHLEYAVEKGRNVFMEKSFAVDAPGIRRVLAAGKKAAEKNLKIAGGLMSRHNMPLEEAVQKIHGGAIGKVITCWAYREHGPVGFTPKSEDERAGQPDSQLQLLHLAERQLPARLADPQPRRLLLGEDAGPSRPRGRAAGRFARRRSTVRPLRRRVHFADGTRLFAQGRHMANCWGFFGDVIHGQNAAAVLGEESPCRGFTRATTRRSTTWPGSTKVRT